MTCNNTYNDYECNDYGGSCESGGSGGSDCPPDSVVYVSSVSVSPSCVNLKVGEWYYGASAYTYPWNASNSTIRWYSENSCIASVNAYNGYIYAYSTGTTKIYAMATDGSGCSDYLTVTVSNTVPVTSVTLNRSSISLEEGDSISLSATVCPDNATNKAVNWSSSNTNVATVSGGVVCGIASGTARITAAATDGSGHSSSCTVVVSDNNLVTSICINPGVKTMIKGKSLYFYATVCPENANNKCITWSSSNTCVASVNSVSGLVYAQNPGTTVIRAIAQDGSGVVGTCSLTVIDSIRVENITLSSSQLTMYKGDVHKLTATVCPENATKKTIRWRSSNTAVATVNAYTGHITAKDAGLATIYAEAQDGSGVRSGCTVIVKQTIICPDEEKPVNIVPDSTFADPVDVYTGAHC